MSSKPRWKIPVETRPEHDEAQMMALYIVMVLFLASLLGAILVFRYPEQLLLY